MVDKLVVPPEMVTLLLLSAAIVSFSPWFLVLLIGIILIGALINLAIAQVIKALGLQLADKGMGGVFGFARGVLIILTLVVVAGLTSLPQQPFWKDALLSPLFEQGARMLKPLLSDAWAAHVNHV